MRNKILVWILIILFIVLVVLWLYKKKYLYIDPGSKLIKLSTLSFKDRILKAAQYEWDLWNLPTVKKESSSSMESTLRKYWEEGAGSKFPGYSTPWSAVFISYLMKKAGAGKDFPYSASHHTYIVQSIKNKLLGTGVFQGYKMNEAKPEIGDLLAFPRQSGVTYDTTKYYSSHTDLVIAHNGDHLITIGGNLSNTVKKTKVDLDANGYVKNPKYIAVIKNTL